MAAESFLEETAEQLIELVRISGYLRELINPMVQGALYHGIALVAVNVAHLFTHEAAVVNRRTEVVLKRFAQRVGKAISPRHQLLSVDNLDVGSFYDLIVGIKAVQQGALG
jgi:hypothetical protein